MRIACLIALIPAFAGSVNAQIAPPNDAGISMGHVHLNVTDVEAQTRFWVAMFDAKPLAREGLAGVKVPGMLILFDRATPTHPSSATVLDHFGFKVHNRDEMVARGRAAGYTIGRIFTGSEGFPNAYVVGPDGVNVEMQEEAALHVLAVAQHLHYRLPEPLPLRTWYIDTFAMSPSTRGPYGSADIPGMNLTFAPAKGGVLGTKGGLIDHIGFEVGNLAEFCRRLEAAGVKLDVPYTRAAGSGIASAFLTDPSGILIELTEGLGGY